MRWRRRHRLTAAVTMAPHPPAMLLLGTGRQSGRSSSAEAAPLFTFAAVNRSPPGAGNSQIGFRQVQKRTINGQKNGWARGQTKTEVQSAVCISLVLKGHLVRPTRFELVT